VVDRIITNLAVIDVVRRGTLLVRELAPGVTKAQVGALTDAALTWP
jgi:acyl CoA:acetate/3-ketoacid CoA transferase beta subunit